ncbi:MAG: hypothetical protein N2645_00010 [Clostridia bacterium]|nr:hypothetical protein [Clostridia bacterium]
MRSEFKILFFSLIVAFLITACGGSGSKTNTEISSLSNNVVGSASLKVSAKFPVNDENGAIGKSKIDPNTATIQVYVYQGSTSKNVTLTPQKPSANISGLLPGEFSISIFTNDSNQNELDYLYGKGVLVDGENNFTATLLRANWEFVDNTGAKKTITLNKTLNSSQETIWGFSIAPNQNAYGYAKIKKSAIDPQNPWQYVTYPFLWRGSNFNTNAGADSSEYHSGYIYYVNQFIGPNTSNNALDMAYDIEYNGLPLTPTSNYSGEMTNRYAFIIGLPVTFDIFGEKYNLTPGTFTQNGVDVSGDINSLATTKVINSDTIEGNIIEVWERSSSQGTRKCYTNASKTTQITCPSNPTGSQKVGKTSKMKMMKKYLANALKSDIKKSVIEHPGCINNVVNTWTDEYWNYYYNGSNFVEYYEVWENVSVTFDACYHSFTAKASNLDLPGSNMSLNLQKTSKK